jgi:hypothetical protein
MGCVANEKTIPLDPCPEWLVEEDFPRLEVTSGPAIQ